MSFQRRRERYTLIYAWKILHGSVPNDVGLSWSNSVRRGTVAVIPRFPSTVSKINTSFDSFFKVRAAKLWNCLPKKINSQSSLGTFKSHLDAFLSTVPDRPPVPGYSTANSNSLLDWLGFGNT